MGTKKNKQKERKQSKQKERVCGAELVGVQELRENLSDYTRRTAHGEEFLVIKRSRPVFRIVPVDENMTKEHNLMKWKKMMEK